MARVSRPGRNNQKLRTRKHLLDTAATLISQGIKPTVDEVAEAALVSRATAYRYFPNADTMILEASFHLDTPQLENVFEGLADTNPTARLQRVDQAFHDMVNTNEAQLRMMLGQLLIAGPPGEATETPTRQNRRSPLILSALEPTQAEFTPSNLDKLCKAVAMLIGPEAMFVCKDVLHLEDKETRKVKQWAIQALVDYARRKPGTSA